MLVEPGGHRVQIQGVGVQPVDGGEVAAVGQGGVQRPEHLDDAHGGLCHRLGEVAARRRHRTHGSERAGALLRAHAADHAGPLIELGQTGSQIRGVALLTGHLLQTAGHLAQGLSPAGGGVGDDGHVVAHVPEVLGDGDTGVDRRLTGGHGHIGGVGDQHRPLHQAFAGAGVRQLGEFTEHVGHLVAPLAAADVDHDVHVCPLGQLVLHHGLAGAEGPGYGGSAALGDGEHRVDDPLARLQRCLRREFLLVGAAHADRPLLHHGQLTLCTVGGADAGDGPGDVVLPRLRQPRYRAADAVGDHDLVQHRLCLRHGAQHIAACHGIADGGGGSKGPQLFAVQRRHLDAAGDVGAHAADDLLQRTLDAVVDVLDEARAQLHAEGRAGGDHLCAGAKAGRLLVYLNGGAVAGHIQDLSDQMLGAYAHYVRHAGVRHAVGHHQRTGDFDDLTHSSAPFRKYPRLRRVPRLRAAHGPQGPARRSCRE